MPDPAARRSAYWRRNVRILTVLLLVWAAVSYLFGILLVDTLNRVRIPGSGFKLGFWFAQQGSIYVFVVLIAVYVRPMNRLDREFGVDEREDEELELGG
jgi:putative solute:sodium symporter small subunit